MIVYIDDVSRIDPENKGSILSVSCSDEASNRFVLLLDMVYMGIDWEGELEDELYKDIQRAYDICIEEKGNIDIDYMTKIVEKNYYGMIQLQCFVFYYLSGIDPFFGVDRSFFIIQTLWQD